uniref:A4_EXTRA domain-containing protein n=1 Tax=Ascaris lumbricoides TaxID=6252 RepID=A0A9J2PAN7_ASCLU
MAANVDSMRSEKRHEKFVPLVAFECGFRNKFMAEDGTWVNDVNRYATCQSGKLDILKYCRKAYPKLDITNIVEYSHETKIASWCREEGKPCKWTHTVRPYQCIGKVGEFHSEALQVPHGCRFGHVNDRQSCNDYSHWKDEAQTKLTNEVVLNRHGLVTCDLLVGSEVWMGHVNQLCRRSTKQVDSPADAVLTSLLGDVDARPVPPAIQVTSVDLPIVEQPAQPQQKVDDQRPAEAPKDLRRSITINTLHSVSSRKVNAGLVAEHVDRVVDLDRKKEEDDEADDDYDEDYSDEDDEDDKEIDAKSSTQDPYFKISDPANEHERFKEAEQRLDKKHRAKIDKVMREWSDLEARYKKMKQTDEKGAEAFKLEMTARFQKTVASLEEENKEQKKQIEDVHEERVQANLNEKKRQAEAEAFKPVLLHRLRYIDLRINGTLAMLRDFPELERQVRPIAIEFWSDYRRENTPEVTDDEYTTIGGDEQNAKLVQMYKDSYDRIHNPIGTKKASATTTSPPTTSKTSEILDDSEEDDDDDESTEESVEVKKAPKNLQKIAIEKIVKKPIAKNNKDLHPVNEDDSDEEDEVEDDDDDDEGDDDALESDKSIERELHVEIEPIVNDQVRVHDIPPRPAYAKHEPLVQHKMEAEHSSSSSHLGVSTHMMLIFAASATIVLAVFAVLITRRRSRHAGFIEVDVCTPEERHVNGMQVNGYENPTYSFFDSKP